MTDEISAASTLIAESREYGFAGFMFICFMVMTAYEKMQYVRQKKMLIDHYEKIISDLISKLDK